MTDLTKLTDAEVGALMDKLAADVEAALFTPSYHQVKDKFRCAEFEYLKRQTDYWNRLNMPPEPDYLGKIGVEYAATWARFHCTDHEDMHPVEMRKKLRQLAI